MRLADIPTPALLLDRHKLESNLRGMAAKAERLGVRLRPHIKTHKSLEVARRQLELGAHGITVSTLYEARTFARAGFDDVTWAFPIILDRVHEVIELSDEIDLGVTVDSLEAVDTLIRSGSSPRAYLKIDCGYHRAGVDPRSDLAVEIASRLADAPALRFAGILTHAGHSYHRTGRTALLEVAHEERDVMLETAERLRSAGLPVPIVSVGSTPTASVIDNLDGVDEIRPGNYAFYDLSQVVYGSCAVSDCALTVLTSVVSSQPGARHCCIDAGALALSKDAGPTDLGRTSMGGVFADYDAGRLDPDLDLTVVSQEHGQIGAPIAVGRRLRILPNHSCLTAAQFDAYVVVENESVVDVWPVRRGRSTPDLGSTVQSM